MPYRDQNRKKINKNVTKSKKKKAIKKWLTAKSVEVGLRLKANVMAEEWRSEKKRESVSFCCNNKAIE
jgi:hypothetical protein